MCRFDIEGDDDTQLNFTSGEQIQMPTTLIPSPRLQDDPQTGQHDDAFKASKSTKIFILLLEYEGLRI